MNEHIWRMFYNLIWFWTTKTIANEIRLRFCLVENCTNFYDYFWKVENKRMFFSNCEVEWKEKKEQWMEKTLKPKT